MRRRSFLIALLLAVAACATTPRVPLNSYGLPVVSSPELYRELVARDARKELVDLQRFVPGIVLDIRYATKENFMKRVLYPEARAFLRRPAAEALREVQAELREKGLGLKVYDAYRPYSVTVAMWEPIKDPDYVADPAKGSRHNRGCAVDLTLIHLEDGQELPMPTAYDAFVPAAAHSFAALPPEVLANRALLRDVMDRHGFEPFESEWWHYDFRGWEEFEILDVPFGER